LSLGATIGHYALGMAAHERNDLANAEEHFGAVVAAQDEGHFLATGDCMLALSLTYQAQGRTELARRTAAQASQRLVGSGNEAQLSATRAIEARLACLRGDLGAAVQWLRAWHEDDSVLDLWRFGVPRLTRAQVLITQNTPESLQLASRELAVLAQECAARFDIT